MQPTLAGEEQGAGEGFSATLCFPNPDPIYGVPCLSPNLLEGNPLAGNDQQAGEIYEKLTKEIVY